MTKDIITGILNDKQDITNQLGQTPETTPVLKTFSDKILVKPLVTKQIVKSVAGSMIWGSQDFAIWGEDIWGEESGSSFILNSTSFGILGQNKLGSSGSEEKLYSVLPNNNIFEEYFSQTDYIDTSNSTGTINTTNEEYSLDMGEVLQSDVIAKLREPIVSARVISNSSFDDDQTETMILGSLQLGTSTFTEDNVELYLSNDSGSTWYKVNEGSTFTFPSSSSSDELKYKIEALQSVTISKPLKIQVNN